MRSLSRLVGAGIVAVLLMLPGIGSAAAHAALESATPADRSIEIAAPTSFRLEFDEPVGVTDLRLVDAEGATQAIEVEARDAVVSGIIQTPLRDGTYVIAYRVISADGHPVAGAVQFQVGAGPSHWRAAMVGLAWWQWGKIGSLLVLYLGGFTFWAASYRILRRRLVQGGAGPGWFSTWSSLAVIVAACLLLGFQGAGLTGEDAAQFLTPSAWAAALATPEGRTALLFTLAMIAGWLAGVGLPYPYLTTGLIWASGGALIAALATVGHIAILGWPQMTVLAVHVAGALLWTGSLVPLLRRLSQPAAPSTAAPPPWSRSSSIMILGVVVSGIGLACWQIVAPTALLTTAYGLVLTIKILVVVALIASLIVNRRMTRPERRTGWPRLWLLTQAVLMVFVLVLTATLGQLTPPRHLLAAGATGAIAAEKPIATAMVHAGDAMAMLTLRPSGDGQYELAVSFATMNGEMLHPQQVALAISNLDARIGPLTRQMAGDSQAVTFTTDRLDLVPAGRWRLEVTVDLSDFDRRSFVLESVIPPAGQ